jgi:TRAP-type C4-dicarboxylate transport system permease small subunit
MHAETTEHVQLALKVFVWVIMPLSLVYMFGTRFLLNQNLWGSMLWGMGAYFYSNFLPDLPSINRKRKRDLEDPDLPWYKKYALLLFAPLFIWLLFSDVRINWKTEETYHNFSSLAVYGIFLFAISLLAFVSVPLTIPSLLEAVFLLFSGVAGFLTHLKVDKIW